MTDKTKLIVTAAIVLFSVGSSGGMAAWYVNKMQKLMQEEDKRLDKKIKANQEMLDQLASMQAKKG